MIGALRSITRLFFKTAPWSHINFATDDRLDAMLDSRLVKFDRTEHISVIGQRESRHPILFGQVASLIKPNGSVQQTILAMDMKMDEIGMFHGFKFPFEVEGLRIVLLSQDLRQNLSCL